MMEVNYIGRNKGKKTKAVLSKSCNRTAWLIRWSAAEWPAAKRKYCLHLLDIWRSQWPGISTVWHKENAATNIFTYEQGAIRKDHRSKFLSITWKKYCCPIDMQNVARAKKVQSHRKMCHLPSVKIYNYLACFLCTKVILLCYYYLLLVQRSLIAIVMVIMD